MKNVYFAILCLTFLLFYINSASAENQFRLNPYILAANISGSLATEGNASDVDLGIGDAINKGNGALGIDFEIRNGGWSLLSQFMFTQLSDTKPDVPKLVFDAAQQNFDHTLLTEAIGYSLIGEGKDGYLDLVVGGRLASIKNELELRGGPEDRRKYESNETWVDPIVGLYSMLPIDDETIFQLGGDVGGFNTGSKITWQAVAGVDFVLSQKASLSLAYRAVNEDYESDDNKIVYDITMHGPVIGFDFRF